MIERFYHRGRRRRALALCAQLGNHGRRQFDPGHPNAPLAEGDGDAAGSMPNSRAGLVPARSARKSNGWLDDRGLEQLRPERQVSLSYPLIEVGLRHGESTNQVELALAYIEC